jgi:hypothetical protein
VEKPGDDAFVGDDFMYGTSAAHCSAEIRNGFLRKVYGWVWPAPPSAARRAARPPASRR